MAVPRAVLKVHYILLLVFVPYPTWSETTLICDPLQGLCPGDNEQRVCTCVITSAKPNTSALRLYTDQSGVFTHGVSFVLNDPVFETNRTDMGFTAILINNTVGSLTANLIFTPDVVSTTGLKITCENPFFPAASNKTMAVMFTYADRPNTPWFTLSSLICNSTDRTYITVFTFNVNETGGSDINYYNGTVTGPSGFSSQFNVTNTAVITGLHCSTSYTINVTAVNCAGVSTVNTTSFTTPQPDIVSPTITNACFESISSIRVDWMPPENTSCGSITGFTLRVLNNIGQSVGSATVDTVTTNTTSIHISNTSTYYNITLSANTTCGMVSNVLLTLHSNNSCPPSNTPAATQTISLVSTAVFPSATPTSSYPDISGVIGGAVGGVATVVVIAITCICILLTCVFCKWCRWCRDTYCSCCCKKMKKLRHCFNATDNLTPPHTPNSSALPDCTSSDQRLVKKKATSSSPSNENSDVPMKLFVKEERSTDVSEKEKISEDQNNYVINFVDSNSVNVTGYAKRDHMQ